MLKMLKLVWVMLTFEKWDSVCLITLATLKWCLYFPSMYFHMPFKITFPQETLATILALIGFLLYVCLQMAFKITLLWEILMEMAAFNFLSPMWILRCILRSLFSVKAISQLLHWYGFCTLWVLR